MTKLDAARRDATHRWPQALPGGKAVLFTASSSTLRFDDATVDVQRVPSGDRKVLVRGGYYGRYLSSGHLAYINDGSLFVAPFDLDRLEVTGPAIRAIAGIAANAKQAAAQFAVANNGTLVYLPGTILGGKAPILWMSADGTTTPLRNPRPRSTTCDLPPMGAGWRWTPSKGAAATSGSMTGPATTCGA